METFAVPCFLHRNFYGFSDTLAFAPENLVLKKGGRIAYGVVCMYGRYSIVPEVLSGSAPLAYHSLQDIFIFQEMSV